MEFVRFLSYLLSLLLDIYSLYSITIITFVQGQKAAHLMDTHQCDILTTYLVFLQPRFKSCVVCNNGYVKTSIT